jgi:hypothetical protein
MLKYLLLNRVVGKTPNGEFSGPVELVKSIGV